LDNGQYMYKIISDIDINYSDIITGTPNTGIKVNYDEINGNKIIPKSEILYIDKYIDRNSCRIRTHMNRGCFDACNHGHTGCKAEFPAGARCDKGSDGRSAVYGDPDKRPE
jgi:hypothetical protein